MGYHTLWDVYLTIPQQAFILRGQVCKLAPSINVVSVLMIIEEVLPNVLCEWSSNYVCHCQVYNI